MILDLSVHLRVMLVLSVLEYACVLFAYRRWLRAGQSLRVAAGWQLLPTDRAVTTPATANDTLLNVALPGVGLFKRGAPVEGVFLLFHQLAFVVAAAGLNGAWSTAAIGAAWCNSFVGVVRVFNAADRRSGRVSWRTFRLSHQPGV